MEGLCKVEPRVPLLEETEPVTEAIMEEVSQPRPCIKGKVHISMDTMISRRRIFGILMRNKDVIKDVIEAIKMALKNIDVSYCNGCFKSANIFSENFI